jgi:DNA-binding NarL/FixJ family response regulator
MQPDVVLMDHYMPEINGTEATRVIRERSPRSRVLMMSASGGPAQVLRALRAGASGFLTKLCRPEELYKAIREVHAGRRYVQRELADKMLGRLLESAHENDDPLERLSVRERQVLQMIVEGRSAAEIAGTLCLSARTVETYRTRLMTKLGFRDVPTLVKFAIRHHLISLDETHHE